MIPLRNPLSCAALVGSLLSVSLAAQAPSGPSRATGDIVLLTSLRERIVRPVVEPFERSSGLGVKIVRVRRPAAAQAESLIREASGGKADVWWCQETLATEALARAGAFGRMDPAPAGAAAIPRELHDDDGLWFGFAPRARVLIVNTERVPQSERPRSMWDLLAPRFEGRVLLARPSSGTALFHLLALRQALGQAENERYLDGLARNRCRVVESDRRLAEMVGSGEALVGMTDTSDCCAALAKGLPVAAIHPDQDGVGTLLIPHTVALFSTSGHPSRARQLIEYLLSEQAEGILVGQKHGQLAVHGGPAAGSTLRAMKVDLARAAELEGTFGVQLRARYAPPAEHVAREGALAVDFDSMTVGGLPTGMTVTQTGGGTTGVWIVTEDESEGGKVLTQTDTTPMGRRYPMCLYDGLSARDVSVSVRFKTMTGDTDRAAGLCVRYIDKDNYYCCRVNSLEDNYRFYRVVDGRRIQIAGKNRVRIPEDVWQSMRIEAKGNHFRMWLNGAVVFEADDDTFARPGKVGLWLKGDSVTSFDDLHIAGPGARRWSGFAGERPGAQPRGFESRSSSGDVAWRVVTADGAASGGVAVTPDAPRGDDGGRRRGGAVLLDDATVAKDVSVLTRFKVATTGDGMHLAGLVARYVDADEHYYLRINPEECNLRLYRVSRGERVLIGERHHTDHDEHAWHTAQLTITGSRFEVLIDGELQFAAHDTAVSAAGKAGVWAVPGGGTLFDEIAVEGFD